MKHFLVPIVYLAFSAPASANDIVLVEVESFAKKGGWVVDQQFMDLMGSPYLLAHGLGEPVPDAVGDATFDEAGDYRVWVRTRDWVAPWKAKGAPGRFQLLMDGKALETTFGTEGDPWHWQDGGIVEVGKSATIALHDLTGFEGRCDAILFCRDHDFLPPDGGEKLEALRSELLGWDKEPADLGEFDLVVIGGGVAGTTSSISAARQGLKVALIQDRPVLGGNGSSEVRVWPEGHINLQPYPHVGDIVGELIPPHPPGQAMAIEGKEYGDERKERLVRAEKNITLLLNHRAIKADAKQATLHADGHINSVVAQHVESGKRVRLSGKFFVDCTGDGVIGALAGAENEVMEKGNMGTTNPWSVGAVQQNEPQLKCLCKDLDPWSFDFKTATKERPFPRCPWAIDMKDMKFPGRKDFVGQWPGGKGALANLGRWFWETGSGKHPINDMEWVRDYNFRAMYGAWDALKNVDKMHANQRLKWSAFICGKRESRRLIGDVVLSASDFRNTTQWPDPAYPCTWHIDIHNPDKEFLDDDVEEPFIARATTGKHYSYKGPYWAPYRTLYSRNVDNLFMAGRDVSCTHDGLGAIRVMRTCGMMGETVGRAAWIAVRHNTTPRGVYKDHLPLLKTLIMQPGAMRRDSLTSELTVPPGVKIVNRQGIDPADIEGIVIDDAAAKLTGRWSTDGKLPGFVAKGYRYSNDPKATATYWLKVPEAGAYDVLINWHSHPNRTKKLNVTVASGYHRRKFSVDQTTQPAEESPFRSLASMSFAADSTVNVTLSNGDNGFAHIDAVVLRKSKKQTTPAKPAPRDRSKADAKSGRPDIVWILAEDISNELACYGEPGVQTPHIDALAKEGTQYERAYCTGPACSVSRSAMMSGVYQTRIDAHDHRRIGSYTFPALTQYLRAAGYYSARGCGFSKKTDLNFKPAEKLFDGTDWKSAKGDQPFFAQITLDCTHRKDESGKTWNAIRKKSADPVQLEEVRLPPYFPDTEVIRQDWAVYLDQIEHMDAQVGQIVARLKKEGRYENALIVFCGDNGRCHLRGKNWLYEPGLKVPLIIKWPGSKRAGEVVSGMVSMLDVTATVIDFAGAKATKKLDGQSLRKPVTRDVIFGARDAGGEVKDHIRSVCNGRWKYIRNYMPGNGYLESKYTRAHRPMRDEMLKLQAAGKLNAVQSLVLAKAKPAEEMYDLSSDPHEIKNLADQPEHAKLKADLAKQLDEWIESTKDTGLAELASNSAASNR